MQSWADENFIVKEKRKAKINFIKKVFLVVEFKINGEMPVVNFLK